MATDMLRKGADWLSDMRHKHATQSVTYTRGAESIAIQASPRFVEYEIPLEFGAVERVVVRDFIVRAADLVLGGSQSEPLRGDQIREVSGTSTLVYEVLPVGSEPHFRPADDFGTELRIHTKHIATE